MVPLFGCADSPLWNYLNSHLCLFTNQLQSQFRIGAQHFCHFLKPDISKLFLNVCIVPDLSEFEYKTPNVTSSTHRMSESMFVAVTVYASDYKVIIVLDNDLYVWHQAITWTITDLLSTTPLRIIVN